MAGITFTYENANDPASFRVNLDYSGTQFAGDGWAGDEKLWLCSNPTDFGSQCHMIAAFVATDPYAYVDPQMFPQGAIVGAHIVSPGYQSLYHFPDVPWQNQPPEPVEAFDGTDWAYLNNIQAYNNTGLPPLTGFTVSNVGTIWRFGMDNPAGVQNFELQYRPQGAGAFQTAATFAATPGARTSYDWDWSQDVRINELAYYDFRARALPND